MYNYKKNRKKLINKQLDEIGYNYCEYCKKSAVYQFHVHHLVHRSKCNRKEVHKIENLILLCDKCHTLLHNNKELNNKLIQERNLTDLLKLDLKPFNDKEPF